MFWVFVFPILLAAILGLAFRSRPPDALRVAVAAGPNAEARRAALAAADGLEPRVLPEKEALEALGRGRVVLVVSAADPPTYSYDRLHHPPEERPFVPRHWAAARAPRRSTSEPEGRVDFPSPLA